MGPGAPSARRQLRGRLGAAASLVRPGSRVADIGSDHGRLPRMLLASGRASHCIATERGSGAGDPIRGFRPGHPLAFRLERRYGEGLSPLREEDAIDAVVIAGMGARKILGILDAGGPAIRRLILQPQSEAGVLRRGLAERGLAPIAERLAWERGRFYEVVAAEAGPLDDLLRHPRLGPRELLEAGPWLVRSQDPLVGRYWRRRLSYGRRMLRLAPAGPSREALVRDTDLARRVLEACDIDPSMPGRDSDGPLL